MPVSIIIPAFNEEKYIEPTLKTLPSEHEIIVVCNGCTDKTEKIARKYTDKVYVLKEKGVSRARNFGAEKASHEKLIFLDADIVIGEDVVNAIEKSKSGLGTIILRPSNRYWKAEFIMFLRNVLAFLSHGGGVIFCDKEIFLRAKKFEEKFTFKEDKRFVRRAKKLTKHKLIRRKGLVDMRRYERLGYTFNFKLIIQSYINPKLKYKAIR